MLTTTKIKPVEEESLNTLAGKYFIVSEYDKPLQKGQVVAEISDQSFLVEINNGTTFMVEFFATPEERDEAYNSFK
jgi:hypothetical protein